MTKTITTPLTPIRSIGEMCVTSACRALLLAATLGVAAVVAPTSAIAGGSCGAGKIVAINESGYGSRDLFIRIDYSAEASVVGDPAYTRWIRFRASMDADSFRGIKALSYLAFSTGKVVRVYAQGDSCSYASDMTIYDSLDPSIFPTPQPL